MHTIIACAFNFCFNIVMLLDNLKKLKAALFSALPVVVTVLVCYFVKILDIDTNTLILFLISCVLIIVGIYLFTLGSDSSMQQMGELVGSSITKKRKIIYLVVIFFLFGFFITVAEPDLSVLAQQISMNSAVFIFVIGIGVGIFCVIGALRILFDKPLKYWLLAFYGLMFALACLVPDKFISICVDSGGVTTGPITVPFILAVGAGLATSRNGRNKNADSFGVLAFSSIGPIITVMILAIIIKTPGAYEFKESVITSIWDRLVSVILPSNSGAGILLQVLISLLPIVIFFVLYNFIFLKLPTKKLLKLLGGTLYVYAGLVLFMIAVEAGFLPVAQKLGLTIGSKDSRWILILVGVFLGLAAALAEPAVHVLTDQIETVSDGSISKPAVLIALAVGNAIAIGISTVRVLVPGFSILYILVPGYIIAFALSFAVPDIYTAIAFDSGGVISGPMNTSFILPFLIGAAYGFGNKEQILTNAFGAVAIVALMPLISIQLVGLIAEFKNRFNMHINRNTIKEPFDDQIIHF